MRSKASDETKKPVTCHALVPQQGGGTAVAASTAASRDKRAAAGAAALWNRDKSCCGATPR